MTENRGRHEEEAGGQRESFFGSLGSIVVLLLICWSVQRALLPLHDNSFFTHLATGRLILDTGAVPSTDPYSYTALGEPWTVQSWLASVAYAAAESLAGGVGIRLVVAVVFVVATLILWKLSAAAASLLPRLTLVAVAMVVGAQTWSERPYMIGVVGIAAVWLAMDGRVPPGLLVPMMWIWANTHGSFPLALLLWATRSAGTALDRRTDSEKSLTRSVRVGWYLALGVVVAPLSPLGLRALTFPLTAVTQTETFQFIVEWQAPEFTSLSERAFLLLVVAAIGSIGARPSWERVLPFTALLAAALIARRNIAMAVPVLVPVIASGLPAIGTLRAETHPRYGRLLAGAAAALVMVVTLAMLAQPSVELAGYPAHAVAFRDATRATGRLITQDFTGNLIEVLDGEAAEVFIDDRVDMYPEEVTEDYRAVNQLDVRWSDVLDRWNADAVVWSRSAPLGAVLAVDPDWRIVYSDPRWFVAERR